MVVDRAELTANLAKFYDFKDKSVVYVGAGGGQLLVPSMGEKKVVAIDSNAEALEAFRNEIPSKWSEVQVSLVPRAFEIVEETGDVVYFEFCLHEMADPSWALDHARSMATDIVVMDHLPHSEWIYYGGEEAAVSKSTKAVESFGIRRHEAHKAEQRFKDYDELASKLSGEGETSRSRVLSLKGKTDIRLRMDYGLFLL